MEAFRLSRNEAFDLVYGMQELVGFFQETGEIKKELIMGSFENVEKEVINKLLIQDYMFALNDKERKVIYMYYFLGFNKTEIAQRIGCGNSTVQRHIGNAFNKIRKLNHTV